MRLFLAFLVPLTMVVACGSTNVDDVLGTANGGDGGVSGGDDAASADGASGDGDVAEGGTKCERLQTTLDRARAQAVKCSLLSGADPQCRKLLDDVCCKLVVTSSDTSEAKNFIAAVEAFKKSGCPTQCTAIRCVDTPTNLCSGLGSQGSCAQQ